MPIAMTMPQKVKDQCSCSGQLENCKQATESPADMCAMGMRQRYS